MDPEILASGVGLVDKRLIGPIDGVYTGHFNHLGRTTASILTDFNPMWEDDPTLEKCDRQFFSAVEFGAGILQRTIRNAVSSAGSYVVAHQALEEALKLGDSIVVVDEKIPWESIAAVVTVKSDARVVVRHCVGGYWKVAPIRHPEPRAELNPELGANVQVTLVSAPELGREKSDHHGSDYR